MKYKGITLVELMIVIAMLGILLVTAITMINPQHQIDKVDDARRKQDIQEIKTGLDTYYNDHNCYPLTLPFGSEWIENSTVYMREVPQDVVCSGNSHCYVYKYEGACPQWSVVFTKLSKAPSAPQCSLTKLSQACVPADYDSTWACVVTGNVDTSGCAHISSSYLSNGSDAAQSSGGTGNGNNAPTPTPATCASKNYKCSGVCNIVAVGTGDYCTSSCDGVCPGR